MAGDWMKVELELPDKPEVHAIAGMLSIDPDLVVGKLLRVWQWFDKHTTDGNAYGVTYSLVDRITSITGFGEAMSFVGWLEQKDLFLVMPKFDKHTSKSAKTRANTSARVANHRNAKVTLDALPREEKRRDISTSLRSVDKPQQKRSTKTKLQDDFAPCETAIQILRDAGISVKDEIAKFRDHAAANGKTQLDWQAAFRTWARNAVKWSAQRQSPSYQPKYQSAADKQREQANRMFGGMTNGRGREIDVSPDGANWDRPALPDAGDDLREEVV
jgi:hypothetical protein